MKLPLQAVGLNDKEMAIKESKKRANIMPVKRDVKITTVPFLCILLSSDLIGEVCLSFLCVFCFLLLLPKYPPTPTSIALPRSAAAMMYDAGVVGGVSECR